MKQIVMSFSNNALFAEIAVVLFVGIFLGALYRVTFLSKERRKQYARCSSMALDDGNGDWVESEVMP